MHTKLLETIIQNTSPTSTTLSDSTSSSSSLLPSSVYPMNNSNQFPNAKRIKMTSSPPSSHSQTSDDVESKLNSILATNLLTNNQINKKIFLVSNSNNNEPNGDDSTLNKQRTNNNSILTPILSNSNFNLLNNKNTNNSKKSNLENTILKLSQQQAHKANNQIVKPVLTQVVSFKSQSNPINNKYLCTNETICNNNSSKIPDTIIKPESTTSNTVNIIKDENSIDDNTVSSTTTTTTSLEMETNEYEKKTIIEDAPLSAPKSSANTNATKKSFACLRNLGSTCYINCIIQVMRYTPGFVISIHRLNKQIDYLKSLNTEIELELMGNNDIIFVKNLHELLVEMSEKEKLDRRPIYTPRKFVNTVWTSLNFWSDGSQQDAHELKQIPTSEICSLTASSSSNASNTNKQTIAMVASNPELISANKMGTRSSSRVASNSNLKAQIETKNLNGSCTRKSNLKISQPDQTNAKQVNLEEDQNKQVKLEPNFNNKLEQSSTNQFPPIRLIKSIPKLKETNSENNFMRTPTKGGASAYNLALIADTLTSNPMTTTNEAANTKELLLNPVKTTRPVGRPSKNKNKIDKVLNKLEVNSIQNTINSNNKKLDDDHYAFKGEEEENQKNIFDLSKETQEKLDEKRSPIKVKFQLDNQTDKYKIISSTTVSNDLKQADDKDLVSKRLKETVDENSKSIGNQQPIELSVACLNKNSTNKKFKAESIIEHNLLLNNSDIDSNSFIIIDSDTDEDLAGEKNALNESNLNHAHNLILKNINKKHNEENEIVDVELFEMPTGDDYDLSKKLIKKEENFNNNLDENECESIIYVSEDSNTKMDYANGTPTKSNIRIKNCFVMLERLNTEKVNESPIKQNHIPSQIKSPLKETTLASTEPIKSIIQTKPGLKRLKSKSKTFPEAIQEASIVESATTGQNSIQSFPSTHTLSKFETTTSQINDLDAITLVNTIKSVNLNYIASTNSNCPSNSSNTTSTTPPMRSKLRSASSSQSNLNQTSPLFNSQPLPPPPPPSAQPLTKSPLNNNNVLSVANTGNTLSSPLPPSPAELLRKYSTSIGYVCEMDKLFKGSSVTVTQCLGCENLRKCPEAFYDRSIPLDTNDTVEDDDESNGVDWISKCLNNESYLNENSKYMCDICASKQEAKIHTQYTKMPNILILHLLSYGITSSVDGNLNAQKLSNRSRLVNYFDYYCTKEVSEMNKFGTSDYFKSPISARRHISHHIASNGNADSLKNQFKLFAVVMHSGVSLNSGHYTAFVNYKIISESVVNDLDANSYFTRSQTNQNEKLCSCFIENCVMSCGKRGRTSSSQNLLANNSNSNSKQSLPDVQLKTNTSSSSLVLSGSASSLNQPEWLHFDDTKVKYLSNVEFHRKIIDSSYDSPYILFYVKG